MALIISAIFLLFKHLFFYCCTLYSNSFFLVLVEVELNILRETTENRQVSLFYLHAKLIFVQLLLLYKSGLFLSRLCNLRFCTLLS